MDAIDVWDSDRSSDSEPMSKEQQNFCLPLEIIATILLLFPPKILVSFMCVCKAWKNLIIDPSFVDQYSKSSASKDEGFLLYMSMHREANMSFNLLHDKSFEEVARLRIPFLSDWKRNMIVGAFNGLLCLSEREGFGFTIYLCNPSVRKYRIIRSSSIDLKLATEIYLGFGYHTEVDDYKVVRIAYGDFDSVDNKTNDSYNVQVEVYSFKTDSWKAIEHIPFPWYFFEECSEVSLNESIYWVAMSGAMAGRELVILSFDLREEAFKVINLPDYDNEEIELMEFLGVFKDALSLFVYCPLLHTQRAEYCDLWVMKEYGRVDSWTKLYTISIEGRVERPLKFTNRGEIILFDDDEHVLVYNFDNRRIIYLGIMATDFSFVTFTNSLVLVNEINEPLHQEASASGAIHEGIVTPVEEEGASAAQPLPSFQQ